MRFWIKQTIWDYFRQKWFLFVFVMVFFCVGIFFGAVAARVISADQAEHLAGYLDGFLEKAAATPIGSQLYFRHNILNNLYIMLAMYLLGLTVVGIPLVLAAVFSRGFILGFTVGFLVREKAFRGFIFALVSVLPHNILVIPAVILGGVSALSFSAVLIKRRFGTRLSSSSSSGLGVYTAIMAALCLLTGLGGVVETYVTPVFIKSAAAWVR